MNGRNGVCWLSGEQLPCQDENAILADAPAELVQQARFAKPRFGNQIDDAELRTGLVEATVQQFQFVFTPHENAETATLRSFFRQRSRSAGSTTARTRPVIRYQTDLTDAE